MTRLSLAVLTELEMMSCCTLTSWTFGNLGFDVGPKSSVRVPLHCLHLAQSALVAFEHFRLIGNGDLRIDNEWEIKTDQLSQDSRECSVRELFQTYKGIEDSTDIQIGVRLIRDACVDDLLAGAPVFQLLLTPPVRPMIRRQGIESSFCLKKQIIVGQPARAEFCCFERRLQPAQQALEFRQQLLMLLTRCAQCISEPIS